MNARAHAKHAHPRAAVDGAQASGLTPQAPARAGAPTGARRRLRRKPPSSRPPRARGSAGTPPRRPSLTAGQTGHPRQRRHPEGVGGGCSICPRSARVPCALAQRCGCCWAPPAPTQPRQRHSLSTEQRSRTNKMQDRGVRLAARARSAERRAPAPGPRPPRQRPGRTAPQRCRPRRTAPRRARTRGRRGRRRRRRRGRQRRAAAAGCRLRLVCARRVCGLCKHLAVCSVRYAVALARGCAGAVTAARRGQQRAPPRARRTQLWQALEVGDARGGGAA